MMNTLQALCDLNHQMKEKLAVDDINSEEITALVDKREQILQELLTYVSEHPGFARSNEWRDAVQDTQHLVELMQLKTAAIGKTLHKYRHGNKSVQQYKKFL
ncbi:flagellar protein FliT [Vibrio furnissii]|uniref:flagellar protein FliT n=1 Tax=Vibrio furnissii TaxID=29494 RepID=UPI001302D302|nr:flagellar protein FliT [Vibrio furnissii]